MSLEGAVYGVIRRNPRSLTDQLLEYRPLNLILLKMLPPAILCKLIQATDFKVLTLTSGYSEVVTASRSYLCAT